MNVVKEHLLFSHRQKIKHQFEKWCEENLVVISGASFLVWAEPKGWINVDKVLDDLGDGA